MIRFGVVCEGATDFITVSNFLGASLSNRGIQSEFIDLHPGMDKTSEANCGWSNALIWLQNNSIKHRRFNILGQGLFRGYTCAKKCDAVLIILDTDCIYDEGFLRYVKKKGFEVPNVVTPEESFEEMLRVLHFFSGTSPDTCLQEMHIVGSACHNSESWCLGVLEDVFEGRVEDVPRDDCSAHLREKLSDLVGGRIPIGRRELKDRELREAYCRKHLARAEVLEGQSFSYVRLVEDAEELGV